MERDCAKTPLLLDFAESRHSALAVSYVMIQLVISIRQCNEYRLMNRKLWGGV